ncbi:LOW QUALITY PROTEIN: Pentatricopeptide repeat [Dillenia turbinata]|uniref:Pentatricopeptide repeat n=1 Tax=Dillenia turbinata TaxID=194707 RepID=A0AAN8ZQA3_9MAGN
MSTLKVFKTLRRVFSVNPTLAPNQRIAKNICTILKYSDLKSLKSKNLLSDLNSEVIHLVLSNPYLKIQSCLYFFKFLQRNLTFCSYKPDLQAYVILKVKSKKVCRSKNYVEFCCCYDNLGFPVSVIADLVDEYDYEKMISPKLLDTLFRVSADDELFNEALEFFHYMKNNGVELEERSCMVFLRALKRANNMVDSGVQITAMSVVVDVLCKIGEIRKARKLIDGMGGRGVKPNVFTYSSWLDACIRKHDMTGK